MSLENDAERGRLADAVLQNRVYVESYVLIEQGIYAKWAESRDKEEREQLHKLLQMLSKARTLLETTMRSGKVAAEELNRRRTLAERVGLRR